MAQLPCAPSDSSLQQVQETPEIAKASGVADPFATNVAMHQNPGTSR
jgi:hypothetical protein